MRKLRNYCDNQITRYHAKKGLKQNLSYKIMLILNLDNLNNLANNKDRLKSDLLQCTLYKL